MNQSATQALPFSTYRIETVTVERKPPKPRLPRVPKQIIYWSRLIVEPEVYFKPEYERVAARVMALSAPENIWRPGLFVPPKLLPRIREPRVVMSYPFVGKPRDEHAELLAVNKLVPQMPGREDICQEIMLALWEKKISLDDLKANRADIRGFVRRFTKDNYEVGGYAISLDAPMHTGQSWHDVLAAPEAEP